MASCLRSWAFRTMGSAQAPHRRSATIVAARCTSADSGPFRLPSQTNISGSMSFRIVAIILRHSFSKIETANLGGSAFRCSIWWTSDFEAPERPTRRSRAIGGQVAMRRICSTPGRARRRSGVRSERLLVQRRAASTSRIASDRFSRNVLGANFRNQSLKRSIDLAMSDCHRSRLSRLTAN